MATGPWSNRLENVEVSRQDQVWVPDITYVRLNGRFIYVYLLMDVFTRMIKAWQVRQHLNQSLTLKPLEETLCHSVPEIHHSDQGVQYLSTAYLSTLKEHGIQISLARRGHPWENGYAERLIRTLKRKTFTSMTMRILPRLDNASGSYHTGVSRETPTFGVRVSDTYRISTKKLVLTLLNFGLNKRWHFRGFHLYLSSLSRLPEGR